MSLVGPQSSERRCQTQAEEQLCQLSMSAKQGLLMCWPAQEPCEVTCWQTGSWASPGWCPEPYWYSHRRACPAP